MNNLPTLDELRIDCGLERLRLGATIIQQTIFDRIKNDIIKGNMIKNNINSIAPICFLKDFFSKETHFLYILYCTNLINKKQTPKWVLNKLDKYGFYIYVGETSNIIRRIVEHKRGSGSPKTSLFMEIELKYLECYNSKDHSYILKRENEISRLTMEQQKNIVDLFYDNEPNASFIINNLNEIINNWRTNI